MKGLKITLLSLSIFSSYSFALPNAVIGYETINATEILSQVVNDNEIVYVNFNELLSGRVPYGSNSLNNLNIRDEIINNNRKYIFDYTSINNDKMGGARHKTEKIFGISFKSKMLVISSYKGELKFTPFDNITSSVIDTLNEMDPVLSRNRRSSSLENLTTRSENESPAQSFYITVNKPISKDNCVILDNKLGDFELRKHGSQEEFCDENANISLNYRITLLRSFPVKGSEGKITPDQKIVKISLDNSSAGAGIYLSERLKWNRQRAIGTQNYISSWKYANTLGPIAQFYEFGVKASNDKAKIISTYPIDNLNANYNQTDVSTFEAGVSTTAESDLKVGATGSINYSEQNRFTFNTKEYEVVRTPYSANNIGFRWQRQQFDTAQSIQEKYTSEAGLGFKDPILKPANETHVNPIGYSGFVPNFQVIYGAEPSVTGVSTFSLESSVGVHGFTYNTYNNASVYYSYKAKETSISVTTDTQKFSVDWNSPVFLGKSALNLQLGGSMNNTCIEIGLNNAVTTNTCNINSSNQAFIYDSLSRYVSVNDPMKCLDATDLTQLKNCSLNRSQVWKWKKSGNKFTDVLETNYLGKEEALTHNSSGKLFLSIASSSDNESTQLLTNKVNLL
ncbi:leukocidin family pore-forming toxin [Vibrio splendidus]|uniref:leukocidin family pore-forming toxin n=1 Tax=Vibrio splendidus TaxID=29497 RepID=UPI0011B8549D|nr:leukocidin family pore-forming toxin [Vibrio splendidus]